MLDQSIIEKLEPKNFNQLDLQSLRNDQVIARMEELASDGQYEFEPMSAREFYEALEELMKKFGAQIKDTKESARLNLVMKKLLWQALPVLEPKMRRNMLSENVIFALKNKIEILTNIDSYLAIYEFGVGPNSEERQMFLDSLTHNEEILGGQSIALKSGDTVTSYISNWLKDYISYTDRDNVDLTGESYELTQYFYSNPNVKKLGSADKEILARVIAIYNDLRYPKYIPIIEPEEKRESLNVPKPAPKQPVVPKPPVIKPLPTDFDKKLAAVAVPAAPAATIPHGQDLEVLRKQMAVKAASVPKPTAAPPPAVRMTPEEIKREVDELELPVHKEEIKPSGYNPSVPDLSGTSPLILRGDKIATKPPLNIRGGGASAPGALRTGTLQSISQINAVDDLKKVDVNHLRQGQLASQISIIKSQISKLATANNLLPYYTVTAFEQSPLFKAYLLHGNAKFANDPNIGELTQEEFEAIADLKKEIERL